MADYLNTLTNFGSNLIFFGKGAELIQSKKFFWIKKFFPFLKLISFKLDPSVYFSDNN